MELQDRQYIPVSDKFIKNQIRLCIIAIIICAGMLVSEIIFESVRIPRHKYDPSSITYILLTGNYRALFNFIYIILFILIQVGIYKYLSKTGANKIKHILLALIVLSALLAFSNQFFQAANKYAEIKKIVLYTLEPCVLILYLITGILLIKYKDDSSGRLNILGVGFLFKAIVAIASLALTFYLQAEVAEIKKSSDNNTFSFDDLLKVKYIMDASKEFLKQAMPAADLVILVYVSYLYLLTRKKKIDYQ